MNAMILIFEGASVGSPSAVHRKILTKSVIWCIIDTWVVLIILGDET